MNYRGEHVFQRHGHPLVPGTNGRQKALQQTTVRVFIQIYN